VQWGFYDSFGPRLGILIARLMFRYDLHVVRKILGILLRIVWLAICVTALVYAHRGYQGISDWKMEERLAFELMVLSFPSSLLVAVGLALTGAILGLFHLALPASSKLEMTATWLLFVVAGYAQWFILLPRFLKRRGKGARNLNE
jgi:hypothetical protein